jgi:acyl carrier protein
MSFEKVAGVVGNYAKVNKEEIREDSRIREDLMIKSVDIVNMIVQLEEEFGIEIDMSKVSQSAFLTVRSINALVESLIHNVDSSVK